MLPIELTTTWICESQDVPRFLKQLDALSVFLMTRIDISTYSSACVQPEDA